jgi:F-type H+-transporting ATPase subunit b
VSEQNFYFKLDSYFIYIMELLTPGIGLIAWQLLIFLSLFFLLKKFAWKGILSALSEREEDISSALRMAEETRAEMAKLKSDNEKLLAEARLERDQMIKEAKDTTSRMISDAKTTASAEANKIMSDARATMTQDRTAMISDLKKEVASLSIEIAEKLIKRELTSKDAHSKLVSELISEANLN